MERDTQLNASKPGEDAGAALDAPHAVGETRKKILTKPEGLAPKVARLGVFLGVDASVLAFAGYRQVQGQLNESLIGAGSQMMLLAEADRQDAPRELLVNGQRIHFSSGIAPMTPDVLLGRFEARCQQVDAGLMAQFAETISEHPEAPESERLSRLSPILREERGGVGYVACFDLGRERVSLDTIVQRFRAYRASRDLSDFGDLRYVYAKPASRPGHTHFVAIWSEGTLRMDQLLVESGDARGEDPASIPRPPGSRRVLTAQEGGVDEIARIYQGAELEEGQLDSFYRRELTANGWTILEGDPRANTRDIRPALVARRGDRLAFFALSTDANGRGSAAIVTSAADGDADDS